MSTPTAQPKQVLHAQIAEARKKIEGLEGKLRSLDELLADIASQRQQYQILAELGDSLEKLGNMGAANLFWAGQLSGLDQKQKVQQIRSAVTEFQQKISAIEQSRISLQGNIQDQQNFIRNLNDRLADMQATERKIKYQYVIERTARELPDRPVVMPWSSQGDDERLFHKILTIVLLLAVALGMLVSLWKVPPLDREKEIVMPERLAKLVKKIQAKPPAPKPEERKEEKKKEKERQEETAPVKEARPMDTREARAKAETKGVLAFKSNFADLMKDSSSGKLGAHARISGSGKQTAGTAAPRRSIIVAQGSSGGINTSNLSRQSVSGAGQNLASPPAVKFSRVESAIGTDVKEADRPLSRSSGPARTDEEIQIIFDRYKSALYRIYNRELRSDPSLRGKMVLRITIQPDGHVSACTVKSTDLTSPTLATDIVDRVLKFNFGPKEGVPEVTILYPIEFLPAT